MKRIFKLLLLSPIAFSSVSCGEQPKPIDIVIISGQSNGVGCTRSEFIKRLQGTDVYDEYFIGYPEIKIAFDSWTKDYVNNQSTFYSQNTSKDNNFVRVQLGQGNSEATFGPEIGIAKKMREEYGDKLFLIKYACGASNLQDDWAKRNSPMYGRFVDYVKLQMDNLKSQGYAPTIKAVCWMQGEGDSYDGYYQNYYTNLKEFVGNLRDDLKELADNKEFPFIDAGISNASPWVYYKEVNDAKKRFADESDNNFYIDTIAASLHTDREPFNEPDLCHYDSESEIKLGELFAEQFEQFLTK